jgi:hypothetical protein
MGAIVGLGALLTTVALLALGVVVTTGPATRQPVTRPT